MTLSDTKTAITTTEEERAQIDPEKALRLPSYQADLPDNRQVTVARHGESFLVSFRNKEGIETTLKLSGDAAGALCSCLCACFEI